MLNHNSGPCDPWLVPQHNIPKKFALSKQNTPKLTLKNNVTIV